MVTNKTQEMGRQMADSMQVSSTMPVREIVEKLSKVK
jgi:hypothetical protein